jgi:hypothetical protein
MGAWTPSLVLLVGVRLGRLRGALLWASVAGLVCDCLAGRPLGVTAFAAGMTVAVLRVLRPTQGGWRAETLDAFAGVAVIEFAARLVAITGEGPLNPAAIGGDAFRVAVTSAGVVLALEACSRLFRRRDEEIQSPLVPLRR